MVGKLLCYSALPLLLLLSNSSGNPTSGGGQVVPEGQNPGPDAVAGDMAGLAEYGVNGTQRGLATGITTCNAGSQVIDFFAMPNTHHPAVAQNLYRMSGGVNNDDRFEQIGQSWVKHTYGAKQANSCNFGCQPGGDFTHLGVGCSDTYFSSQSAEQGDLGSRAWINPFTGVFPTNARDHTGHVHNQVSHMMIVESADLNQTLNAGATYYAELQYVTPDEYAWCQTHSGECNMNNNSSYRRYNVSGTTSFTFVAAGAPVRMTPALAGWSGATISTVEPEPGVDGRAFVAYKVTGPVAGVYHYEYAVYNQNLDRAIQSFAVTLGCGLTVSNVGFHAPQNQPPFPNDGTLGDAGFSNAVWNSNQDGKLITWNTETFAQNQNANAIRWGTIYNFRFDSDRSPIDTNAYIEFFKTGTGIALPIQGPDGCNGVTPSPTPTGTASPSASANPTITPSATPTVTPTASPSVTPTATPTVSPSPAAQAHNLSTRLLVQTGDNVGIGGFILTGTEPKSIVLRGIGPSLSSIGVPIPLANPVLELHGPPGFETIVNDNWRDGSCMPLIQPCPLCPTNDLESAICVTLEPAAYTAVLKGQNDGTGLGLVEVYDGSQGGSKLANISTRAFVGTGDEVVIAGFILGGNTGSSRVAVRGIGPTLSDVPNALADPTLELRDANGVVLVANNNWLDDVKQAAALTAAGLAPFSPTESGIITTLPPATYTAILAGMNAGTGVGLIEVYELGAP